MQIQDCSRKQNMAWQHCIQMLPRCITIPHGTNDVANRLSLDGQNPVRPDDLYPLPGSTFPVLLSYQSRVYEVYHILNTLYSRVTGLCNLGICKYAHIVFVYVWFINVLFVWKYLAAGSPLQTTRGQNSPTIITSECACPGKPPGSRLRRCLPAALLESTTISSFDASSSPKSHPQFNAKSESLVLLR